ncbi:sensor histidine kinase [Ichthyenterobacterium magnum]|uniref:histidine kinase n=1 Tax=Ichthyenterobacterium magnum TaxID=1230530 RepID=A0A420DLH1_9FLAO|nr:HAMP domain-containing sensor histidine kinase [Ichthyenterobacterium magnum]RKE95092.1 two-component system phosphate regulon sensor histidine kinase PhoR [Ichthyenterobacterium magnum]
MGKKLFVLLVVLMSLSLIGIIFVQAFFINNTLENEEKNFTSNVIRSLSSVSKAIEKVELLGYNKLYQEIIESGKKPDTTELKASIVFDTFDEENNRYIRNRNAISEESFKVPSQFFDIDFDTISISKFTNIRERKVFERTEVDGKVSIKPIETIKNFSAMDEIDRAIYKSSYREFFKDYPVYKRISSEEVFNLLEKQLEANNVKTNFEFAIYDEDLATKVQSDNFEKTPNSTIGVPVFLDNNNESDFILYVDFPQRRKFLLSSVLGMIALSIIFTSIIILAYSSAIYQLIKQRQISQIKTDFINNMTHEFKTPIATINLALDSIKNPKIIGDQDKVKRYLKMIKDENKRMHAQVENVLRISKLEKNELNISKERVKLHDLLEDALTHVELIVEDRKGYIKTHFNAEKTSVLANETHFTNVIVNILDNAIKYSDDEPKIDVYTENAGTNVLLKIADQGNGMSKQVQRRVFEKFYREHTGNVHNVKGHGLGLAYVKRIVDDHQGYITVESEKGKGSVFTIKLPLIS